jgi:hypothetical protein
LTIYDLSGIAFDGLTIYYFSVSSVADKWCDTSHPTVLLTIFYFSVLSVCSVADQKTVFIGVNLCLFVAFSLTIYY